MLNVRYFEFRHEDDVLIEYRRAGECNMCAACCKVRIQWSTGQLPNDPFLGWNHRNGNRASTIGAKVSTAVLINGRWRFFDDVIIGTEPEICNMLTADNKCKMHTGKALISTAWPMNPAHVAALPECCYSFEEIGRWKLSECWQDNEPQAEAV